MASNLQWLYSGESFTPTTDDYGFIYLLTYEDGTKYIGKKNFFKELTLPLLQSGKRRPNSCIIGRNQNGKRVQYEVVLKESNWKSYESSSLATRNKTLVSKEILAVAPTKRRLTYLEVKYQFLHEVLENDNYLNDNILGKFYKGNL